MYTHRASHRTGFVNKNMLFVVYSQVAWFSTFFSLIRSANFATSVCTESQLIVPLNSLIKAAQTKRWGSTRGGGEVTGERWRETKGERATQDRGGECLFEGGNRVSLAVWHLLGVSTPVAPSITPSLPLHPYFNSPLSAAFTLCPGVAPGLIKNF